MIRCVDRWLGEWSNAQQMSDGQPQVWQANGGDRRLTLQGLPLVAAIGQRQHQHLRLQGVDHPIFGHATILVLLTFGHGGAIALYRFASSLVHSIGTRES